MIGNVISGPGAGGALCKDSASGAMYIALEGDDKIVLSKTVVERIDKDITPEGAKNLLIIWKSGLVSTVQLEAASAAEPTAPVQAAPVQAAPQQQYYAPVPPQPAPQQPAYAPQPAPARAPRQNPDWKKTLGKSKLRLALLVLGVIALVLAVIVFTMDVGSYENNYTYGGDAYTGIQNAAAQAANNIQDLARIVRFGFGSLLSILGGGMLTGALCVDFKK